MDPKRKHERGKTRVPGGGSGRVHRIREMWILDETGLHRRGPWGKCEMLMHRDPCFWSNYENCPLESLRKLHRYPITSSLIYFQREKNMISASLILVCLIFFILPLSKFQNLFFSYIIMIMKMDLNNMFNYLNNIFCFF